MQKKDHQRHWRHYIGYIRDLAGFYKEMQGEHIIIYAFLACVTNALPSFIAGLECIAAFMCFFGHGAR